MKKTLLISIQPQWLYKILTGDKTYEVRKVVPKWVLEALERGETVEAYLYCTKGKPYLYYNFGYKEYVLCDDKNNLTYYHSDFQKVMGSNLINGTIPVKVVIDGYDTYYLERPLNLEVAYRGIKNEHGCEYSKDIKADLIKHSGLTFTQLFDYGTKRFDGQQSVIKALHISKVEVLDKPMELGDFHIGDNCITDPKEYHMSNDYGSITRPPQNMMIVWVK